MADDCATLQKLSAVAAHRLTRAEQAVANALSAQAKAQERLDTACEDERQKRNSCENALSDMRRKPASEQHRIWHDECDRRLDEAEQTLREAEAALAECDDAVRMAQKQYLKCRTRHEQAERKYDRALTARRLQREEREAEETLEAAVHASRRDGLQLKEVIR